MSAPALTASPLRRQTTWATVAWTVGWYVAVSAVAIGYVRVVPGGRAHAAGVVALLVPVQSAGLLVLTHLALRRAGTGWAALGFVRPTPRLLHLLWQVPATLFAAGLVQMLMTEILGRRPTNLRGLQHVVDHVGPGSLVAMLVGLVVLTPLGEEAFFRGVVHGGLRRRWPVGAAVPVSAAVFALAHLQPTVMPSIFVLGVALALLREFHRSLWGPVLLHATVNGLAAVALLVAALH